MTAQPLSSAAIERAITSIAAEDTSSRSAALFSECCREVERNIDALRVSSLHYSRNICGGDMHELKFSESAFVTRLYVSLIEFRSSSPCGAVLRDQFLPKIEAIIQSLLRAASGAPGLAGQDTKAAQRLAQTHAMLTSLDRSALMQIIEQDTETEEGDVAH